MEMMQILLRNEREALVTKIPAGTPFAEIITRGIKDDEVIMIRMKDGTGMEAKEYYTKRNGFESPVTEILYFEGKHLCKYCGEIADGPDEDVLCAECRECFGHAFYKEL